MILRQPGAGAAALDQETISGLDLYRVNFEVNNLKPLACLAFRIPIRQNTSGTPYLW
jgi:hypothetical protein